MGHSHRETWRDDDEPLEVYHMDPYGISLFYGHSQWEHGQNDDEALELFFFPRIHLDVHCQASGSISPETPIILQFGVGLKSRETPKSGVAMDPGIWDSRLGN